MHNKTAARHKRKHINAINNNHYFSNAFGCSQSLPRSYSNETECLYVGSGTQSFSPAKDVSDEIYKSACSSMCSAASTVASALCSIEGSVSFPSSSETTFDLARHLTMRLSEQQESRNRRCDAERGWRHCNAPSERHRLDSFGDTCQAEKLSFIDLSDRRRCASPAPRQEQPPPALEEFSLGSGDPYAACDLSPVARINKSML